LHRVLAEGVYGDRQVMQFNLFKMNFICEICREKFKTKKDLKLHILEHKLNDLKGTYRSPKSGDLE
jgi:hypothetical protein